MKRNRILIITALLFVAITSTGCADFPPLSEEQTSMIAEYSAGKLLRHSKDYEYRLITEEDAKRENASPSPKPTEEGVTPEPTEVATFTPEPSQSEEPTQSEEPEDDLSEDPGKAKEVKDDLEEKSLSGIMNVSGVDFSYKSYSLVDKYLEKGVVIKAPKGQKLLVVNFDVKNTTSSTKKVDLMKRQQSSANKLEFPVTLDGAKYSPSISILQNGGLNYLKTTLGAKKSENASIIYNVPNSVKGAKEIVLTIKSKNAKTTINVK